MLCGQNQPKQSDDCENIHEPSPAKLPEPRLGRRDLLKIAGGLTFVGTGLVASSASASTHARDQGHGPALGDVDGVLVDVNQCVGCRLCEYACKQANGIDPGSLESYDDQSACFAQRRPAPDALTVVAASTPPGSPGPVFTKLNCMHCNDPACVSACIVGALTKEANGAVVYDAWKCIGCRYCMVACPFQLPAYSYDDVLTPEVRKCQFCFHRSAEGQKPACVEACPQQALTFGKRDELIATAHARIAARPDRYVDHVYGEHEVGGTSWMYLSPVPFEQLGFLTLSSTAPPRLTEAIQHGVFKYWIAPVGWYSFLATMMWYTGRRSRLARAAAAADDVEAEAAAPQVQDLIARLGGERHVSALSVFGAESGSNVAVLDPPRSTVELDEEDDAPIDEAPDHEHGPPHKASHAEHHPAPVGGKLLTPGVWVLVAMVLIGVAFGLYRFIFGLAASTNLNQQYPWGLWIAMDVGSGIALAGGGFVTAALVHIFHREHYHAVARSALLTALLGYTFYVPGLLADIGRWYNIWHPTLPNMWQANSVLFEVGICVMLYLNVQYAELAPIICERLVGEKKRFPRLARWAAFAHRWLEFVLPALLVAGVALSTFHQSSLGNLMVIAPYKLHHLWWTPISPLLFLLSAVMVGFPMVIFTILFASWSLKRKPEMHVLAPLSLYVPLFLAIYLIVKVADVIYRGVYPALYTDPYHGPLWLAEVGLGVVAPLVMLLRPRVRQTPRLLAIAMLLVILGVVLNRLNCFVLAYHPPYVEKPYFPSIPEFGVSMGLVAALLLVYRVAVTYLPILERRPEAGR